MRTVFVLIFLTLILRAKAAETDAASDLSLARKFSPILILTEETGDKVEVGVPAADTYGSGYRYPVRGQWPRLKQARGVIQAVRSQRLPKLAENPRPQGIDLVRIQTVNGNNQDQADIDIENKGLRLLAKLATGAASGIAFGFIGWYGLSAAYADSGDETGDGLESATFFVLGAAIGCTLGFPLGVTAADSYDSARMTLLCSGVAFLGGISLLKVGLRLRSDTLAEAGFISSFAGPPIVSIVVSEKSRKSPQDRRVSFGLAPISNGGLFAVSKLNF